MPRTVRTIPLIASSEWRHPLRRTRDSGRSVAEREAVARVRLRLVAVLAASLAPVFTFAAAQSTTAVARPAYTNEGVRLTLSGARTPIEMCGARRSARLVPTGARVTTLIRLAGGRDAQRGARRASLVVDRCHNGRWRRLGSQRFGTLGTNSRAPRYRIRVDTTGHGDFRLQVRVRGDKGRRAGRSRFTYLRVGRGGELRVRKNVKDLTSLERQRFVDAVLELKSTPSPYDLRYSYYDQFVAWHQSLSRCHAGDPLVDQGMTGHAGPIFLPWHRQFLVMFEDALREVSGKPITVPYWDWTDPQSTTAVYAQDFMGGDGDPNEDYAVTTGPFRNGKWKLVVQPAGVQGSGSATPYLTRHIGVFDGIRLPTAAEVEHLFAVPFYDVAPFDDRSNSGRSFRNALEGWPQRVPTGELICPPDGWTAAVPVAAGHQMHNAVHLWAGGNTARIPGTIRFGTMGVIQTSPNDPVFWLNHSNVDRVWAQWQERHGTHTYQPTAGVADNSVDDVMHPFDEHGVRATPRDVADIAALGYRYTGRSGRSRVGARNAKRDATESASRTRPGRELICRLDPERLVVTTPR